MFARPPTSGVDGVAIVLAVTCNIASAEAARSLTLGTAKFAASLPYSKGFGEVRPARVYARRCVDRRCPTHQVEALGVSNGYCDRAYVEKSDRDVRQ